MRADPARPDEPLSTHTSTQILLRPNVLPNVTVRLDDSGPTNGVMFLTVDTRHRAKEFEHSASFTVSGSPLAVDRLLLRMRAAFAASQPPQE
jgi:hypothetical protein